MAQFTITGGQRLSGVLAAGGSKNAALPMMAAAILAGEPVILRCVPRLEDVQTLCRLLGELGLEAQWIADGALRLQAVDGQRTRAGYRLVRRMRASFCVLGPLLARRGRAVVALPGGCNIGPRPVDLHLRGLAALGADLRLEHGYVVAEARRLVGASVCLAGPRGPTVTGTANVLCAAVLAQGDTTITGAAAEPEIVDLGRLLERMGARIEGLGTSTIRVVGVKELGGAEHRIIPDRIEAATLLLAAAVTGGTATVTHVRPEQLAGVLDRFEAAGARIQSGPDRVSMAAPQRPQPIEVVARPYPGVPTDLQAQFMAWLSLAQGRSLVRDEVFPARFLHVAELNRLGARIDARDGTAIVEGVERLTGAAVRACDLRASAALVLAGLAAEGETRVHHAEHLDRGYERLDQKLARLGAQIARC